MILPAFTCPLPAVCATTTSPSSAQTDQAHFHYLQLGISKQWLPYGKTTLYADYGLYKNFNVGNLLKADLVNPGNLVIWGTLAETEVRRWGFGVEQSFDDRGLLLYAQAHHYEAAGHRLPVRCGPCAVPGGVRWRSQQSGGPADEAVVRVRGRGAHSLLSRVSQPGRRLARCVRFRCFPARRPLIAR